MTLSLVSIRLLLYLQQQCGSSLSALAQIGGPCCCISFGRLATLFDTPTHWFSTSLSLLLERLYVHTSSLQFRLTGKTFSLDSGEVSVFRGLKSVLNTLSCHRINRTKTYISSTWVSFLILLSLISLPSEIWVETGIDELNNCRPVMTNSTGVCSSPWNGHSDVGIASAALLVQRSAWIDSDWDIVYEGSSVNMSLNDVHVNEIGKFALSNAQPAALASNCNVQVQPCTNCGTLTVGKDCGTFDTIITNASIVDAPNYCQKKNDANYCRGDVTYDTATGLAFFFWSVRTENENGQRQVATKGIEVLLNEQDKRKVLTGNEAVWKISPDSNRSRLYSISCASKGLHWTDLTRAVSIYRTVQMERPGEKKENVNGNIKNIMPLTSSDVLRSLFALKAEDISSTCDGLVPQYTQCGTFDVSKASILLVVNSFAVLLYLALRIAGLKQRHVPFPTNVSSWKKYATGARESNGDFAIAMESESPDNRLVVIDLSRLMSKSLSYQQPKAPVIEVTSSTASHLVSNTSDERRELVQKRAACMPAG
ncbi:unnamed protein product [Agarophyton chilense]